MPYVVLLLKAVQQWSAANGGELPKAYKQKKEARAAAHAAPGRPSALPRTSLPLWWQVRALVEAMRRPKLQAAQNIEEALSAVNTALNTAAPSSSAR